MVDIMKMRKHYAFVQEDFDYSTLGWYKTKYYIDHILVPLLEEKDYDAVDAFVEQEKFNEIAWLGILRKVDFSDYIINWWIPRRSEKGIPKIMNHKVYQEDMRIFNCSSLITLNKEASMSLVEWFIWYTHKHDFLSVGAYMKFHLPATPLFTRFDTDYDEFLKSWLKMQTNSQEYFGEIVNLWIEREPAHLLEKDIKGYFNYYQSSRVINYYREKQEAFQWITDSFYLLDEETQNSFPDWTKFGIAYNDSATPEIKERARQEHRTFVAVEKPQIHYMPLMAIRAGLITDTEQYVADFPTTRTQTVGVFLASFTPLDDWMIQEAISQGKLNDAVFQDEYCSPTLNSYLKLQNVNGIMDKAYIEQLHFEARKAIGVTDDMYAPDKWVESILEASV